MKFLTIAIAVLLYCGMAWSGEITGQATADDTPALSKHVAGDQLSIVFTGSDTLHAEHQYATRWLHIGYSQEDATYEQNRKIAIFNPRVFTLNLNLDNYNVGTAADISYAYFETTLDTTEVIWIQLASNDSTFDVGDVVYGDSSGASGIVLTEETTDSIFTISMYVGKFGEDDNLYSGDTGDEGIDSVANYPQFTWNGDTSNVFMDDGYYTHPEYNSWRYENLSDTARTWAHALKVLQGGYLRVVFDADSTDTTVVNWTLVCGN
jgi:hypothetical protein